MNITFDRLQKLTADCYSCLIQDTELTESKSKSGLIHNISVRPELIRVFRQSSCRRWLSRKPGGRLPLFLPDPLASYVN